MTHTITLSPDGKYIILKIVGTIDRKSAMQQNQEAHEIGRKLGINRYFVDLTEARNTDSVIDSYEFAYKDMQNTPTVDKSARVAMLVSPGDRSHDFIVTVATNAGLNVALFADRDQALRSLLRD